MSYKEPTTIVKVASKKNNINIVEVFIEKKPSEPIAPAGLYSLEQPDNLIYPLHRLVLDKGHTLTFETYDQNYQLPMKGKYIFRSWWIPKALAAVRDIDAVWVERVMPEREHDHCLLSYDKIGEGGETNKGYFNKKYGWITVAAYEEYIVNDRLRLRSKKVNRNE